MIRYFCDNCNKEIKSGLNNNPGYDIMLDFKDLKKGISTSEIGLCKTTLCKDCFLKVVNLIELKINL